MTKLKTEAWFVGCLPINKQGTALKEGNSWYLLTTLLQKS